MGLLEYLFRLRLNALIQRIPNVFNGLWNGTDESIIIEEGDNQQVKLNKLNAVLGGGLVLYLDSINALIVVLTGHY